MIESLESRRLFSQLLVTLEYGTEGFVQGGTYTQTFGVTDGTFNANFVNLSFTDEAFAVHETQTFKIKVKGNESVDLAALQATGSNSIQSGGNVAWGFATNADIISVDFKGKPQ